MPLTRAFTPFLLAVLAFTTSCDVERTESDIADEAGKSLDSIVEALEDIKDSETATAARAQIGKAVDELDALVKEVREGQYDQEQLKKAWSENVAPRLDDLQKRGGEALKKLGETVIKDPKILTTGLVTEIQKLWNRTSEAVDALGDK